MYRLVIVDDERGVHALLKDYIENEIGGYQVAGCFVSGADAIEFIAEHDVEVVITDIRMSRMSGLELARHIYENRPDIKTIIISGYSEFEYAKKAIAYNVAEYLVKPIRVDELKNILNKIADELDRQNEAAEDEQMQLRENFLTDLIIGVFSEQEQITSEFAKLGLPFAAEQTKISIFDFSFENYRDILNTRWNYEKESFENAVFSVVQSAANLLGQCVAVPLYFQENKSIIAFLTQEKILDIGAMAEVQLTEILGLHAQASCMTDFCSLAEIARRPDIFNQAELYKIMISYIKMRDAGSAKDILGRILSMPNPDNAEDGLVTQTMRDSGSVDAVYLELNNSLKDKKIIETARKYMQDNFDKDISRADIADTVSFNAAYFARYYKKQTGVSIGDYLRDLRMKKAMELLDANIRISDIPLRCGYQNLRNFQKIFKAYTGYSPQEYRNTVLKKNQG